MNGKGLVEQTETNATFLVVKHNAIIQDSKVPRDGFTPIEVQNPRTGESVTKFIKKYKAVDGLVYKIEWYDTEEKYEQRYIGWKIYINANGIPCVLDLPFDSRASNRFMKVAENLNFSLPVEFRAWYDNKTDATAFFVGQNGKSVPQVYTRENPGDCPPPLQNPVSKKWNFDGQKVFLHERMTKFVIPAVDAVGNVPPTSELDRKTVTEDSEEYHEREYDDSEIPF